MSVLIRTQEICQEVRDMLNVGYDYWKAGELSEALKHYLDSIELLREKGNKLAEAKFHTGIGNVYDNLNEDDKAWSHHNAAWVCAHSIEDRNEQGIAENNVGFLLIKLDRLDEAREWLGRAERSFCETGDAVNRARTLETLSSLYQKEFAYRRATKAACESTLTLIDWIERDPLFESLTRAEQVIRAYRIQVALEMFPVAKAAVKLGMSRQNLERILKDEFPELEEYARRGERRGVHAKKV